MYLDDSETNNLIMKQKPLFTILFLFFCSTFSFAQTIGLLQNDEASFNGYTLFSPLSSHHTYLIDNCGNEIHSWQGTAKPGQLAYLLEDGRLLRCEQANSTFIAGGTGGRILLIEQDGTISWSYEYTSSTFHQHHDLEFLPNGNILILAWELHSVNEAIAAGRNPSFINSAGIWTEKIVEVQPIGSDQIQVVWEWRMWDHLIQDFDASKNNYGVVADHPELLDFNFGANNSKDWVHLNSIDYNAELDQILMSSRHLSEIYVIDHSTTTAEAQAHTGGNSGKGGDFLYRYGNPQAYDRGTSADRVLFGQHDAHWIEDGLVDGGKIMVFNNGYARPGGSYSSIDIIDPPVNNNGVYTLLNGQAYGPNSFDWTYEDSPVTNFFSSYISGAQRLLNGNTLICKGSTGDFFEVDYNGSVVWRYRNPVGVNGPASQGDDFSEPVFRAYRYGANYQGLAGLDLTPGDPIELNPLPSTCETFGCKVPFNINANTISGNCTQLTWTPATDAKKYKFWYRKIGNSDWIERLPPAHVLFLNDLVPNTSYEYKVKTICTADASAWSPVYNFTTLGDLCDRPTTLNNATAITYNAATITWTAETNDVKYKIAYKEAGTSSWTFLWPTNNNVSLSALTNNTTYKYKVKSKCSSNLWTNWTDKKDFTTTDPPSFSNFEFKTQQENIGGVKVHPNPTNDILNIELPDTRIKSIQIFNAFGQLVKRLKLEENRLLEVDCSSLASGVYMLVVETEKQGKVSSKFTKL